MFTAKVFAQIPVQDLDPPSQFLENFEVVFPAGQTGLQSMLLLLDAGQELVNLVLILKLAVIIHLNAVYPSFYSVENHALSNFF